jgi:alginate O-acetyltransferase complex protein AlgI
VLFNSIPFLFVFLPIAYTVFWCLRGARARFAWLAVTGYWFYAYWNPKFCLLMAFSTIVSYWAGLAILRGRALGQVKRRYLVIPVTVDLMLLGFFKYAGFFSRNVNDVFALIGVSTRIPVLDVILPVGISFYTFHTISYIVDAYRGTITPTRNLFEFSAYVSLFSQLVAGPIVRFRQIEGDLRAIGRKRFDHWLAIGLAFFVYGLVEKVLVADSLARYVDPLWKQSTSLSTVGAWQGALGYSFQLLFDFSGYSSMAVGLGYLFGLRVPQNFDSPYKATDPSDFWRRWHISLSSCLRDYVYIPLGGSRSGGAATYRNLLLTMLIGGLWHGANWTFVAWGAYHGLLLMAHRRFRSMWDSVPRWSATSSTFLLVVFGWVLFRAASFSDAAVVYRAMLGLGDGTVREPSGLFVGLVCLAAAWSIGGPNAFQLLRDFRWRPALLVPLAAGFGACLAIIVGGRSSPFLYFQF